jgi:hypothetical protein
VSHRANATPLQTLILLGRLTEYGRFLAPSTSCLTIPLSAPPWALAPVTSIVSRDQTIWDFFSRGWVFVSINQGRNTFPPFDWVVRQTRHGVHFNSLHGYLVVIDSQSLPRVHMCRQVRRRRKKGPPLPSHLLPRHGPPNVIGDEPPVPPVQTLAPPPSTIGGR